MATGLHTFDRWLTALRHRHSGLRHLLPYGAIRWVNLSRSALLRARATLTRVEHPSPLANVYHCCVHKTGSQWLTAVLSDLVTYRYSGLLGYQYQIRRREGYDPRPITSRVFPQGFPARTIVTPLYLDYGNFRSMPKAEPYRAVFVQRDPRDVTVSWYFSARFSHLEMGDIPAMRERLTGMDKERGLIEVIRYLEGQGLYEALGSWVTPEAAADPTVLVISYEELASPRSGELFREVYDHLGIPVPEDEMAELVDAYSFARLSGRKQGEVDPRSHVRKGGAGDWRKHFTPAVTRELEERTGDLVQRLGYE